MGSQHGTQKNADWNDGDNNYDVRLDQMKQERHSQQSQNDPDGTFILTIHSCKC